MNILVSRFAAALWNFPDKAGKTAILGGKALPESSAGEGKT